MITNGRVRKKHVMDVVKSTRSQLLNKCVLRGREDDYSKVKSQFESKGWEVDKRETDKMGSTYQVDVCTHTRYRVASLLICNNTK